MAARKRNCGRQEPTPPDASSLNGGWSMKSNGYILFETSQVVAIATGFATPSKNEKTGPMIQIWFLVKSRDPVRAVESGLDRLVCGSCPLRGANGHGRQCYVNLGQAPLGVWKAWRKGIYPLLPSPALFAGHSVRFGAYGDPTLLPFALAKAITEVSNGHTGYTHQWRRPSFQPWKALIQASVETEQEQETASAMGWSTFRVIPKESSEVPSNGFECLADSKGIQCADCLACKGTKHKPKAVWIRAHGNGAKYFHN